MKEYLSKENYVSHPEDKKEFAFGLLFLILMAPFLIAGLVALTIFIYKEYSLIKAKKECTEMVVGEVYKIEKRYYERDEFARRRDYRRMKGKYKKAPGFRFEYNGQLYCVLGDTFSRSCHYSVGDEVEIYVDPENPNHIYVPSYVENNDGYMSDIIVFGIFCSVGMLFVVKFILKAKKVRKN
jgi:hypothetical protein